MKNYLLFAYGDFKKESSICYVADAIADVTDSDFLKYKSLKTSLIVHFSSKQDFKELTKLVNVVMDKISNCHFLIEYNDNMSVSLPKDEMVEFLTLNNSADFNEVEEQLFDDVINNMITTFKNLSNKEIDDEDEDEEDLYIKKSMKKDFNLDEILDKINENGVSSLTKEENDYLKKLSK